MFYYLTIMRFDDELRWNFELSLYKLSDQELKGSYFYKIPITKEKYIELFNHFKKESDWWLD